MILLKRVRVGNEAKLGNLILRSLMTVLTHETESVIDNSAIFGNLVCITPLQGLRGGLL